ncbi:hypothetical protein [Mycobacterium sp.]|uniref:hypothetical protein n=1 Tax=Mycobacterium sp. TaxID=1785 RepID=UPI003A83FCB4
MCGKVHEFCTGHLTLLRDPETRQRILDDNGDPIPARDDNGLPIPCRDYAMTAQLVCKRHGGGAPQARAAAKRRIAEQQANDALQKALRNHNAQPVTDPATELSRLAGEMVEIQQAAGTLVANLQNNDNNNDNNDDNTPPSAPGQELLDGTDIHPFVKLFERMSDRLAHILTDMAKLGIAEAHIAVQANQVEILNQALRTVLDKHGIDPTTVLPALADELRQMDAIPTQGTTTK